MIRKRGVTRKFVALTALALVLSTGLVAIPRGAATPRVAGFTTSVSAATVGAGWSEVVPTGIGAEMAGLTWEGGAATVQIRAFDGTNWRDWVELVGEPAEGPDASSPEFKQGRVFAGPTWLGHNIARVEIRVTRGPVTNLQLHAIDSEPPSPPSGTAFGVLPTVDAAAAAVPWPGVITRAQWGADESYRTINDGCNGHPDYASSTRFAVVHHTVNSNDYSPDDSASLVRGIYYFHTHDNGWCDIGYNFLVDRYGQVFEGRYGGLNKSVIGAHAGGFNTYSTGIAVIGNFDIAGVPRAAYQALRSVLAWKLAYHGIDPHGTSIITPYDSPFSRFPAGQPVQLDNIVGHTDVDSTECPGRYLYALLPQLRDDVAFDIAQFPDKRVMGDWDGNGRAGVGIYQNGTFYLRDDLSEGAVQHFVGFGDPGDVPVAGDWNGDHVDTVGVFRNGAWYLRNSNTSGVADITFTFGDPGDIPVVGDWDGNGTVTPGVFRNGVWYLRNSNSTGVADITFGFGDAGDKPLACDCNSDGGWSAGVFRGGTWYLRNSNTTGVADAKIPYGDAGDTPLPHRIGRGMWGLGVARGSYWFLSDEVTGARADHVFPF